MHAGLALKAQGRKLDAWAQLKVQSPPQIGTPTKDVLDISRAPTWKEVDGKKTVQARMLAKEHQDPDLRDGNVEIAGCVSRRPLHLQSISLRASKEWGIRSLDIKNAFLQADGFGREANVRALCERSSQDIRGVWELKAHRTDLNDSPLAFSRPLRKYFANSVESPAAVGLRFEASSSDPCQYFVRRSSGGAVGAITTHIDDILGCSGPELFLKAGRYPEKRCGELKIQEKSSARVCLGLAQENDVRVTLTQEDFTGDMNSPPRVPELAGG